MKKFFMAGLAITILMVVALMSYGAYMNQSGENRIAVRMQEQRLPLQGARVQEREIQEEFLVQDIALSVSDGVDAVALIDGRIQKCFVEWDKTVEKGQLLFEIVNDELPMKLAEADSAILQAKAQLRKAENSFKRYGELVRLNATSMEKYDEVQAEYLAVKAALDQKIAEKELMLVQQGRQQVYAPISGDVLAIYHRAGAHVTAGTPLAMVGQVEQLVFSLFLTDSDARKLNPQGTGTLRINRKELDQVYVSDSKLGDEIGDAEFPIRIKSIQPDMSEPCEIRTVEWQVDNSGWLIEPKVYGLLRVSASQPRKVLSVPMTALFSISTTESHVFVRDENGTLAKRSVTVGMQDSKYAEVISGLQEGDIVITSSKIGLQEGMQVEVSIKEEDAE